MARRGTALGILLALVAACTSGGDDAAPSSPTSAAVSDAPTTSSSDKGEAPTTTARPAIASTSSTSTTSWPATPAAVATTTTTTTAPPPTVAERFAPAVTGPAPNALGTPVPAATRDEVARLWLLHGAVPDPAAVSARAVDAATSAQPIATQAEQFLAAAPIANRLAGADPATTVSTLYDLALGRAPTADEVAAWTTAIAGGTTVAGVALAVVNSPEAVARTGTVAAGPAPAVAVDGVSRGVSDRVLRLYLTLLQRFPRAEELAPTVQRVVAGSPLATIAGELLAGAEYTARRPLAGPDALVDALYADVLGRPADAEGRAAWTGQLAAGVAPGAVAAGFTDSPEAVARTETTPPESPAPPPTPPPPPAGAGGGVFAIGDSVMLGAAGALRSAIPGITVDASVSRQFAEGASIVRSRAAGGDLPATVVVHLGTNGTVSGCDSMMDALAGRRVVLVTVRVPRSWEGQSNDAIRSCAARHGAAVADWHAVADPGILAADGYHVGAAGARRYAELIASTI